MHFDDVTCLSLLLLIHSVISSSTIDLTEEPDSRYDSSEASSEADLCTSGGGRVCPMCGDTFDEAEIQLHADACINAKFVKEKGLSQCTICNKTFRSSLISIHMKQCDGCSSDDDLPVRKSTKVTSGQALVKKRARQQLTLRDLQFGDSSDGDLPVGKSTNRAADVKSGRHSGAQMKKKKKNMLRHSTSQDIDNDSENGRQVP